jgi:membrane protein
VIREKARDLWARARAGFVGRCLDKAIAVALTDRMMALAAQAFLALMPLLILFAVEAPSSLTDGMVDVVRNKLGLHGQTAEDLQNFTSSEDLTGFTVFGVVLVLLSATSFSRALQRMYQACWGLAPGGLRSSAWRQLAWLIGVVAYLVLLGFTFQVLHGDRALTVLRVAVTSVSAAAMWWWTPFVLLAGRVHWRALVPTAVVTTIGTVALGLTSSWYVPHILASNEARYGTIGVAFAVESWLVVLFAVVVGATVVGAVITQSENRPGAWARGGGDASAWRRTPGRDREAEGVSGGHPRRARRDA